MSRIKRHVINLDHDNDHAIHSSGIYDRILIFIKFYIPLSSRDGLGAKLATLRLYFDSV